MTLRLKRAFNNRLQMEKLAEGSPDGLSIYRISLQAWYALTLLCGVAVSS